jgi:CheY-like chemotaxis protein
MTKKLLLADDSITIQKVIQITFAHEDYQLTITDNGDTALVRAEELVPDLVLADVYMPGKNGYELCAAIKQSPALRQVPVLLLAGSFEPFDEGKARAAGADAWIEKPFESQALLDKVSELLSAVPLADATAAPLAAAAEPEPAAATVAEPFADFIFEEPAAAATGPEDFIFEEPAAAATGPEEFVFEDLAADESSFEFIDEPFPAEVARPTAFEAAPAAAPASSGFAAGEEILPLGDDDILGAEDLEPVTEISTLTPWSRDEALAEEPFPAFTELELPPVVPAEQPFTVATPVADLATEPAAEPAMASVAETAVESVAEPHLEAVTEPAAEPVAEPAAEPVTVAAVQGATMLTAAELELIVERAVARALEKLAGTVLERVAWEVVPDLAEALIKEEIRQIKEASF